METEEVSGRPDTAGRDQYRPSGKVKWSRFLPIVVVWSAVALLLAFLLAGVVQYGYILFVSSLALSAPLLGGMVSLVRHGHCRSRFLAGLACAMVALVYYLGFWSLRYQFAANSWGSVLGPAFTRYVGALTGSRGTWGYVLLVCRTARPQARLVYGPDNTLGPVRAYGRQRAVAETKLLEQAAAWFHMDTADFVALINSRRLEATAFFQGRIRLVQRTDQGLIGYVLELIILMVLAWAVGQSAARRVYYERAGRWAAMARYRYRRDCLDRVLEAIRTDAWYTLQQLPESRHGRSAVIVEFEYLPASGTAPFYLTVWGRADQKVSTVDRLLWLVLGRSPRLIRQRRLPPKSARLIARNLSKVQVPASASDTESEVLAGNSGPPVSLAMAAADSLEQLKCVPPGLAPTELGVSLCLPAERIHNPEQRLRSTSYLTLLALSLVALACGTGLLTWLTHWPFDVRAQLERIALTTELAGGIALGAGLSGAVVLLVAGGMVQAFLVARRLTSRVGALPIDPASTPTVLVCYHLRDSAHTAHPANDIGICAVNRAHNQLLIEGFNYRLILCGRDVIRLSLSDENEPAEVALDVRIGSQVLALALYPARAGWAAFFPFPSGRRSEALYRFLRGALVTNTAPATDQFRI